MCRNPLYQIKLDISAAEIELKLPLGFTPDMGLAMFNDGQVSVQITLANSTDKGKGPIENKGI